MDPIRATITLRNPCDRSLAPLSVNVLVHTGAPHLCIPEHLAIQLKLERQWLVCFAEQAINFELADFSFWRIAPRDARFVMGFGRIHNLSATALAACAKS